MAGKAIEEVKDGDDIAPIDDGAGKSKKKMILMIAVPLILLIGGGAAAYFTGMLDKLMGKGEHTEAGAEGSAEGGEHGAEAAKDGEPKVDEHGNPIEVAFLKIPDMIVNLNSDDGSARYLRLSVQLELESEADRVAVEKVLPRVVDQFQTYLRELRVQDLRGSKGIYRLQLELLNRVNQAAAPVQVKDVLFQEILIQ
jgi:flagellar FliL protein